MTGGGLRRVALALLLLVVALALVTLRMVRTGDAEMKESDAAFDRGEVLPALLHARRAAVLYAPGAPHVSAAYARMVAIAIGAESAGQATVAQQAWQSVRGAALETRHVWVPRRAELARADSNLARLQAESVQRTLPEGTDPRPVIERARAELARDDAPAPAWVAVLVLGFAATALGLIAVALRGVAPDGSLVLSRAKLGFVLGGLGALCWALAVLRA